MLYIPWMVISCGHHIIKITFELPKVKNCINRLCTGPFTRPLLVETAISRRWHGHLSGPRQGRRLQKTSFCIVVGIYCHNIPTRTPQRGYHGVTEVSKTANIPKLAEKCINCISACPTPPHTNPMESGPGNPFSAQNRKKTERFMIFDPKKGGVSFTTSPPPPLSDSLFFFGVFLSMLARAAGLDKLPPTSPPCPLTA